MAVFRKKKISGEVEIVGIEMSFSIKGLLRTVISVLQVAP
jgi:hypothetical protein